LRSGKKYIFYLPNGTIETFFRKAWISEHWHLLNGISKPFGALLYISRDGGLLAVKNAADETL